jgi:hypothetical protein
MTSVAERAPLDEAALDAVWERLAEAVTSVGAPEKEALLLAKLALLMAREIGDPARIEALIAEARMDLE